MDKLFEFHIENGMRRSVCEKGSLAGYTCNYCKKDNACYYHYDKKAMICLDCQNIEIITSKVKTCFKCKNKYKEFTWFDPSSCIICNTSFVD